MPAKHCASCPVTVAQTKIGACLQFAWTAELGLAIAGEDYSQGNPPFCRRLQREAVAPPPKPLDVYCSVDFVPVFPIRPIPPFDLARAVNAGMLGCSAPRGWFKYLENYVTREKPVMASETEDSDPIIPTKSVLLKLLDFPGNGDRYYYVCPGQSLGTADKFVSEDHKRVYVYIKLLKKALVDGVAINMYMVKKDLRKENFKDVFKQYG